MARNSKITMMPKRNVGVRHRKNSRQLEPPPPQLHTFKTRLSSTAFMFLLIAQHKHFSIQSPSNSPVLFKLPQLKRLPLIKQPSHSIPPSFPASLFHPPHPLNSTQHNLPTYPKATPPSSASENTYPCKPSCSHPAANRHFPTPPPRCSTPS